MEDMAGVVYGLRCICHQSGYRYVGKSVSSANSRLRGHRYNAKRGAVLPVYHWMRKHELHNIVSDTLVTCETKEALDQSEIDLIEKYHTHVSEPGGLNVTRGGDGSKGFPQTPEMIAKANASRTVTRGYTGRKTRKPYTRMSPEDKKTSVLRSRARGTDNGKSILTEKDVREIRRLAADGIFMHKDIAQIFGIHKSVVSAIHTKRTWGHVPDMVP